MSDHIHKRHNKSLLLYHFVCPVKYRRNLLSDDVSATFKEICLGIEERYEIHFLEIGFDGDHVHFFDPECSVERCEKYNQCGQEFHGQGNIQAPSRSEKAALRR
jgi:hypothetical protein